MQQQTLKLGMIGALLSLALVGCSTTDTEEQTVGAEETVETTEPVSIGTGAEESVVEVETDPLAGVDTVFYFEFDKSLLKPEARAALMLHAEVLKNNPRQVRLEGHADERGTREYNIALGERRAESVRGFLMQQGVDGRYLEVISYGEERPAAMGSTEESMALNRRVELK
ncbi:peptidoglycan-associated lipoprotein Pal [Porticoccaceae bacterium LTM1]|nr:peptidoglycan-associated lipoprotein Pal [Porticoccaceae bacterium LTM1]